MPNSSKKSDTSDLKTPKRDDSSNKSISSVHSTPTGSGGRRQRRKRRRIEKKESQSRRESLDSQLGDCNIEDVKDIDRRLRKVARANAISSEDMHKVVRRVVRNEHVLALVTLKAEDELAREKREAEIQEEDLEQRSAIIITDTPSVGKLTRAKARELNRTPGITLPPLNKTPVNDEIEALIREDLHSDEEDEEYTFKEDDFHSDEDPNTTASDFDSNPCTPQTPMTANEESPVKLTDDGCFKVPPDKNFDDPRIATRTRSKLCLQQTTIEDLQSEFVPPDVEQSDVLEHDTTALDAEWMKFLNDFTKPLNNSFLGDDDDPINDPEYVAAEGVPVDAEELRDVNISKKELTDLVSELFDGLLQEGVSLDSIELETPQKFLDANQEIVFASLNPTPIEQVTRQIDFDAQPKLTEPPVDANTSITTNAGVESFHPHVMSTPSTMCNFVPVPIAETSVDNSQVDGCTVVNISGEILNQQMPELIAVPLQGQPNCFQLAKVVTQDQAPDNLEYLSTQPSQSAATPQDPHDINFSCKYLSIRKHIHSEYEEQFESLRYVKPALPTPPTNLRGFTQEQHDLLQQQLRIHTQMLTQSFLQTYSHPLLYSMAEKPKEMLLDLHKKAEKDASFNCWNLNGAVDLITKWEHDLSSDEYKEENEKMMRFINKETELTDGNTRQVARLAPRIMDLMLDSQVFMYPQYLPRIAFQSRKVQFTAYAPSEYQLIAMGLEKHLTAISMAKKPLRKGAQPLRIACKRMAKDTIHGKEYRRIFFKINELLDMEQYNPIKYYFEHKRAPPVHQYVWGFGDGVVCTPREQFHLLPNGWKYYIEKNWNNDKRARRSTKHTQVHASAAASASFLQFVREAVGEELVLPDSLGEASAPYGSATGHLSQRTEEPIGTKNSEAKAAQHNHLCCQATKPSTSSSSLTINVNYVFGGQISPGQGAGVSVPLLPVTYADNVVSLNRSLNTSNECNLLALPPPQPALAEDAPPAINFTFNPATETLEIKELQKSAEQTEARITSTTLVDNKKAHRSIFKPIHHRRLRGFGSRRKTYPALRQRLRHKLRKHCKSLIISYGNYLRKQRDLYAHVQPVQYYHIRFLALELYSQLLDDLRIFCQTMDGVSAPQTAEPASVSTQKAQQPKAPQSKRQRCEEAARNRRAHRMEEMQRQMLQQDTPEERNRKDATFAFNFYDKVEEALLKANRLEDCQKFNQLLQTFDPKQDKVSDLYLKVEKLLLPDLPELAEVFLNFLLPAEAAELGKFFEYFMITNASNFINKLNIYFSKQPAQIRKIYACLSELAALPSVSMKKVESKIMPLLKDNPFLCDWFVQQFPQAKPPQRLLPPVEPINMHELATNPNVDSAETITELMDDPPAQGKQPACQIKYFNGRIYYGTKIMLPAKLSFRAASLYNEQSHDLVEEEKITCAHGIRAQGEKLINCASSVDSDDAAERSEEDDPSRALLIDTTTTGEDENSCSSLDICDDATLRAHAIRLNASYYNNCLMNATTSTPNMGSHHAQHHPNAKKTAINFGEVSPRRQSAANVSPQSGLSPLPTLASTLGASPQQDKRKSPSKKVRSPLGPTQARPRYNIQPMVVIHEQPSRTSSASASPAIECAKRLRTLIDQEEPDNKSGIQIIAQAKLSPSPLAPPPPPVAKSEEEQEFLPINSSEEMSLTQQSFPAIKMDISSDEMEIQQHSSAGNTPQHVITTQFDSDEDCKLDVVATLANCTDQQEETPETRTTMAAPPPAATTASAWTREEDKVILIEMKLGARDQQDLIRRIADKLKHRKEHELRARHQFLMDFLSKLQGK